MMRRNELAGPFQVNSQRPPGFVLRERGQDFVLHCEDIPLPKLAERYGTPLYVYSATAIRERLATFNHAFRRVRHTIC